MATQIGFDLTAAVDHWRHELVAQRSLSPDARRELETHLQDSIAALGRRGLNNEDAFRLARKQIGELRLLNREFKKAMKTTFVHWALAAAAWAIFIVSFFLPAFDQMPGWKAATLHSLFWPQALQGNLLAVHYLLLTLANVLMLASPFLVAGGAHDARFLKCLRGWSLAAAVLAWLFLARLLAGHNFHNSDLRIGSYLWASSFVLLCLASLLQPLPIKTKTAQTA